MQDRARHPPHAGLADRLAARVRAKVADGVTHLTSGSGPTLDYSSPPGDPGLFGPDAVCWKIHADFTSMMTGGISALLLQTLHPLALIERVRQIHLGVTGIAPDGRPYRASDPALLTWVHVAEVSSFLNAHLHYVNPALPLAEQDRYFAETACIAERLGALDIPRTRAAIDAYLLAMRPQLETSERTREVVRILMNARPASLPLRPAGILTLNAGVDLLPPWAQQMLGFGAFAGVRRALVRPGVKLVVAPVLRWALTNGVSRRARRRVARPEG